MLVLTRKTGESVKIGDDMVATVLSVRGDRVRLGLLAPKGVPVHREEIAQRFAESQQPAAAG